MRSIFKRDFLYITILIFLPVIFLHKLLSTPTEVFYPADFLLSDLIHVNLSQKAFLAHSYQSGKLPFITDKLANGFPLLAESQIGALSPINYLLYRTLPVEIAFNLTYLLGFVIMNLALYFLLKKLTSNPDLSFFGAVSWMFSGIVIQEIVHQGVLQAIFFVPLTFLLLTQLLEGRSWTWAAILALIVGQQFLFGHFFVALAENIFLLLALTINAYLKKPLWPIYLKQYLVYFGLFIFTISPQLIQTAIYTSFSNRASPSGVDLLTNTFEPAYFITLLTPFPFGSFKEGDFFRSALWGNTQTIPWEACLFIGYALLPGIFLIFKQFKSGLILEIKQKQQLLIWGGMLAASVMLMFGYHTPLKLLFTLPVISSFRILTRFSIFSSFFLLVVFVLLLNRLKLNLIVVLLLTGLQLGGGFWHFYNYFPTLPYGLITQPPKTSAIINNKSYYEFGSANNWFKLFYKNGYSYPKHYLPFHQGQYPYLNLLYGSKSCGLFKYSNYNPNLYNEKIDELDRELGANRENRKLSKKGKELLKELGCEYFLTPYRFKNLILEKRIANYLVYKLDRPLPPYGLTSQIRHSPTNLKQHSLQLLEKTDTKKIFLLMLKEPQTFFLRQLNYPGWQALVNGKSVKIEPVRELYIQVSLPRGRNYLEFNYQPPFWRLSLILSGIGYGTIFWAMIQLFRSKSGKTADPENKPHLSGRE